MIYWYNALLSNEQCWKAASHAEAFPVGNHRIQMINFTDIENQLKVIQAHLH